LSKSIGFKEKTRLMNSNGF